MEKETAEILEVINFIKDRMATKDDLAELRDNMDARFAAVDRRFDSMDARFDAIENRLSSIEVELRDIRQRIEAFEQAVHNISGYAKEIDHLIERVSAIETHLGIKQAIAA